MNFDKAAAGADKQILTVCSEVSFLDPRYYQDDTVKVSNVSLRDKPVEEVVSLLHEIRDSALRVHHQIPSRDTNAMLNAVQAHMAVMPHIAFKGCDERLLASLQETIQAVHARFAESNPRMADSFLRQTMAMGTNDFYHRDARKALRETVNGILEAQVQAAHADPEVALA
jgi:hypothetical protein